MSNTFLALLALADLQSEASSQLQTEPPVENAAASKPPIPLDHQLVGTKPTLHYNIQIHLPATKDVEVFNAIFKSLREHLLD